MKKPASEKAMRVRDVCAVIDELAPPALAYSWDRVGLHTGHPEAEVAGVVVALTVSEESLKLAKRRRAQMIVAHHPLIWEPLTSLRRDDPHAALCLNIAEAGLACYSAHTNLDVIPGGVSYRLADALGLEEVRPLLPVRHAQMVKLVTFVPARHLEAVRAAVCEAGAGHIGDYAYCTFSTPGMGTFRPGELTDPFSGRKGVLNEEPELRFETLVPKARLGEVLRVMVKAHPYEEPAYDIVTLENRDPDVGLGARGRLKPPVSLGEFAKEVRSRLDAQHVRVLGDPARKVKRVGVIGGSGGGQLNEVPRDVDVVVTGDVKYHEGLDAGRGGMAVIDAGHETTERAIVPVLVDYLRKRCKGLRVYACEEPQLFRAITK